MDFKQYMSQSEVMHLVKDVPVSEGMRYHLDKGLGLHDSVYRLYSKAHFALVEEARRLYENGDLALCDSDAELVESDLGLTAEYKGRKVRLDAPFPLKDRLNEAVYKGKKVKLGRPTRTPGESKKFAVYVMGPNGKVRKIRFGDPKLSVKNDNPARAKSFRARHKCDQKKDRLTAGYWACRIGRFAKAVGLKSSRSW